MVRDNTTWAVSLLLAGLDIGVTRKSIQEELYLHPDFPSLLSISDVLRVWNVPHASYELSIEEITETSVPFIAYMANGFTVVNRFDAGRVMISNEHVDKRWIGIEDFNKNYRGTVLVAERDKSSGEIEYVKKRRSELVSAVRFPFVITGTLILFFLGILSNTFYSGPFLWFLILIILFKTIGLVISILLLVQSIDANNPLIQKLCGGNEKKNCNTILSSRAAKIWGEVSWSEIGFFYFASTWLALLFNGGQVNLVQILAFFNIIVIPYTFYSFYYQWRIARQWCVLCCFVQCLLWMEFFAFLPYLTTDFLSLGWGWVNFLTAIMIPLIAWAFVKPYLLSAQQMAPLKRELRRFKYNTDLFNKMLYQEPQYALLDKQYSIVMGGLVAEHTITIVSNPYCGPCSIAHNILRKWLSDRPDIRIQVVFYTIDDEEDTVLKVVDHFMALKSKGDQLLLKRAMDDWYSQRKKNYEEWSKTYPADNLRTNGEALEMQRLWCAMVNARVTPTIFIDGRRVPDPYRLEDIKYMI